jgi:membrane protein required for colicin V production
VPLIWGAYKGYSRGLLLELGTILAFVVATVLGFKLMDKAVGFIKPYIDQESLIPFFSFLLVFIGVLVGLITINKILKKFLDYTIFGIADDIAGAVLGVLKWAFAISVILWLMNEVDIILPQEYSEGSFLYPFIIKYSPVLIDFVAGMMPMAKDLIDSIKENL